jgi:hypothetical protein
MTSKTDFTEEEWARLVRSPFIAGMAISLADPGGPIEAVKETTATLKAVLAAEGGQHGEVAQAIAQEARAHHNPLGGFKPTKGANAGVEILAEIRAASATVGEKASAEEATAFRAWMLAVAQDAADAAKEGGFMGWHAQRVSDGEQKMLDSLREALA